jgi:hypothetical protein
MSFDRSSRLWHRPNLVHYLSSALHTARLEPFVRYLSAYQIQNLLMMKTCYDSAFDLGSVIPVDGTYTVSSLQQAAVVVGGGARVVISSLAAVVGG